MFAFNQSECIICQETLQNRINVTLPCNHTFHSGCIDHHLVDDSRCPVCRVEVPVEEEEQMEAELIGTTGLNPLGLNMLILSKLTVLEEKIDEIGASAAYYSEFTTCCFCGAELRKRRLQSHIRKCIKSMPISHLAKSTKNKQN